MTGVGSDVALSNIMHSALNSHAKTHIFISSMPWYLSDLFIVPVQPMSRVWAIL